MPEPASSVRFADAARRLAVECRAQGLLAPGFRSPPGLAAADRTVRRRADGGTVVAVRVRGRPMTSVLVDLVEGILVANRVTGAGAQTLRRQLLAAVEVGELPARAA